jgi:anti-anti-sigma factor
MRMSVSSARSNNVLTVAVSGEVDLSTARELENAILAAVQADGVTEVRVDLSGVEFLDSSGIALLLRGRRAADDQRVRYRVTGAHGIARQILEITGVWTHLTGESSDSQPSAT